MTVDRRPDLPPELWMRICELACSSDDGTTALSLSQTSRDFYNHVRPSRYHCVALTGWKQVVRFERQFHSDSVLPQHRRIHNLCVDLPSIDEVVYTEDTFEPEDEGEDEDPSYVPFDDEFEENAEERSYEEDDDSASSTSDDSDYYEYRVLTPDELDAEDHDGEISTILDEAEYNLYSGLRRILETAAPTLKILYIHYAPQTSFLFDALFPILPNLEILYISRGPSLFGDNGGSLNKWYSRERMKLPRCPVLFPRIIEAIILETGPTWTDQERRDFMDATAHILPNRRREVASAQSDDRYELDGGAQRLYYRPGDQPLLNLKVPWLQALTGNVTFG
ncbi:hypothetical protein CC1G_06683 [Coprinopsis cinerea okayama7|uniref:Uncharacterized protein n=1 Tax=Coprinopsis cinerea (strain Okayama-7 / 130 / ATCC MYA-4618 / FGSC 9003) TaxID=240176 RepID=A8P806_COPC7|nr:hypothetical protein CC1G_06683 [Coprinopsis cinerea okayama7\|eukprot:XP_001839470.2 hypothetical protein CC1G_06683 [Coprinopsis cinerea okayama7\